MNDHAHADTVIGAYKAGTIEEEQVLSLEIGSQYLRTLSIDIHNTPDIYRNLPSQIHIGLVVDVTARQLSNSQPNFEVCLIIRAQGLDAAPNENVSPRTLYEVNIAYGGLFAVTGPITQETLEPLLLVKAPEHLFPPTRSILLNIVREAGFPVMNIQPINFYDLWVSRKQ